MLIVHRKGERVIVLTLAFRQVGGLQTVARPITYRCLDLFKSGSYGKSGGGELFVVHSKVKIEYNGGVDVLASVCNAGCASVLRSVDQLASM
jgi:hypothetical protein